MREDDSTGHCVHNDGASSNLRSKSRSPVNVHSLISVKAHLVSNLNIILKLCCGFQQKQNIHFLQGIEWLNVLETKLFLTTRPKLWPFIPSNNVVYNDQLCPTICPSVRLSIFPIKNGYFNFVFTFAVRRHRATAYLCLHQNAYTVLSGYLYARLTP